MSCVEWPRETSQSFSGLNASALSLQPCRIRTGFAIAHLLVVCRSTAPKRRVRAGECKPRSTRVRAVLDESCVCHGQPPSGVAATLLAPSDRCARATIWPGPGLNADRLQLWAKRLKVEIIRVSRTRALGHDDRAIPVASTRQRHNAARWGPRAQPTARCRPAKSPSNIRGKP